MDARSPLRMIRVDPARNMSRFYALRVEPTLFAGDWALVRSWGRIGRPGRIRLDLYADRRQAELAFEHLASAKRRRGYVAPQA